MVRLIETELWNDEDTKYLIDYWDKSTYQDLAYAVDKTKLQVQSRIQLLQFHNIIPRKKMMKQWRNEELEFLLENFGKLSAREIADVLGREKDSVAQKITRLRREGKIGYLNENKSPKKRS